MRQRGPWADGKYSLEQFRRWLTAGVDQLGIALAEGRWPLGTTEFHFLDCAFMRSVWCVVDAQGQERLLRQEGRDVPRVADFRVPPGQVPSSSLEYRQAEYHLAYKSGDKEAIFEWARVVADGEALRPQWIVEQLIEWRRDGSPHARRDFNKWMQEYWNPVGVRDPATVLELIKRDLAILFGYLDRRGSKTVEDLYEHLGQEQNPKIGGERVREIIAHYRNYFKIWKTGDLTP